MAVKAKAAASAVRNSMKIYLKDNQSICSCYTISPSPFAFVLGIVPWHEYIVNFYGSSFPRELLGNFGQKFVKLAFVNNGYTIHH